MKLDVSCMRYLQKDDFRVLTAIEMGMRNHELVPLELIISIAKLRHGGSHKILSNLLRHKLVAHSSQEYNGYRLSYLGYDILALKTFLSRGIIASVGSQIGVGKESDIFEAQDSEGNEVVIKIHRLGRTSFRAVRRHRDYLGKKSKASWLYMSRLAAMKEIAFMRALYAHGFPTPVPIDHNRHVVVMSRISGFPMAQIKTGKMNGAEQIFKVCVSILQRLAEHGLVHCDFNEFNLMVDDSGKVTLIDFPQMVPTTHPNAAELFERDLNCLIKFFAMKMCYVASPDQRLRLQDITCNSGDILTGSLELPIDDVSKQDQELFEQYMLQSRENYGGGDDEYEEDNSDYDDDEDDMNSEIVGMTVTEDDSNNNGNKASSLTSDDVVLPTIYLKELSLVSDELSLLAEPATILDCNYNQESNDLASDHQNNLQTNDLVNKNEFDNKEENDSKIGNAVNNDPAAVTKDIADEMMQEIKAKMKRANNKGRQKFGSRNSTKKRNKYGKIDHRDRSELTDW